MVKSGKTPLVKQGVALMVENAKVLNTLTTGKGSACFSIQLFWVVANQKSLSTAEGSVLRVLRSGQQVFLSVAEPHCGMNAPPLCDHPCLVVLVLLDTCVQPVRSMRIPVCSPCAL